MLLARVQLRPVLRVPLLARLSSTHTVRDRYNKMLAGGQIVPDAAQAAAVEELDKAFRRITRYAAQRHGARIAAAAAAALPAPPAPAAESTAPATAAATAPAPTPDPLAPPPDVLATGTVPRGLYIHGPVGTGKSMLMDVLHDAVTEATVHPTVHATVHPHAGKESAPMRVPVRRVHFHSFMLEVHARVHAWKGAAVAAGQRSKHVDRRPERDGIVQVAKQIAGEAWLLCFDEFQVTDVADAMILQRLFTTLFRDGVMVVATSNRPPEDLYKDGLNREYFMPFVDVLKAHCKVHELAASTDYRTVDAVLQPGCWLAPADEAATEALLHQARQLVAAATATGTGTGTGDAASEQAVDLQREADIPVMMGRVLRVRMPGPRIAIASFEELCARPRGAADYAALARAVDVLFLHDIPRMRRSKHNEARRFITLVDELYEHRCAVHATAAVPLQALFTQLLAHSSLSGSHSRGAFTQDASGSSSAAQPQSLPQDKEVLEAGTAYADPAATDDIAIQFDDDDSDLTDGRSSSSSAPLPASVDGVAGAGAGAGGVTDGKGGLPVSVVTSSAERAALGELAFACRRALSRLTEMTSAGYAVKHSTQATRQRVAAASAQKQRY